MAKEMYRVVVSTPIQQVKLSDDVQMRIPVRDAAIADRALRLLARRYRMPLFKQTTR